MKPVLSWDLCKDRQGFFLSIQVYFLSFLALHLLKYYISMKAFLTIVLLVLSNIFMTIAWYGHLKLKEYSWFSNLSLFKVILFSWLIALFEYAVQVPANRLGFEGNGGPFTIWQLKVIQEVITLVVFTLFTLIAFKGETFRVNHLIGFVFLVLAVYFLFKK